MTSITIPLPDEDWARLQAVASLLGQTPEELARAGIERLLQRSDAELLRAASPSTPSTDGADKTSRSITELQGLGRDIWRGIDAQEYVRRERNAWGG